MHPVLCKAQNGLVAVLQEFRAYWISLLVLIVLAQQLPHLSAVLQAAGFGGALIVAAVISGWLATELFLRGPRIKSKGKAVLITGCDTGFGHRLAMRLAIREDFQVFAGCLQPDSDGAQRLRLIVTDDKLHVIPLDVTNAEQIQDALRYVKANLNGNQLWSVIANAGVNIFLEFEWIPIKDIEFLFDVNVMGVVRVSKTFLPLLRNSRGRLVLVASYAGRIASSSIVPYSMTKAAVIAMADGLRREMAKWGLHVATVEPFYYRTAINFNESQQDMMSRFRRDVPLQIQQEYGDYPAQAFQWILSCLRRVSRANVDEVVDQMVNAVTDREPKRHYRCDGFLNWLLSSALFVLPSVAQDIAVSFFEPNFRANEKSGLLLEIGAPSVTKIDDG
ncbi:17-beta-hydroxysteroid dehydrogenase type 6-like [Varroa jacobsoni]|uniref:17-beta-hydroxysteroid dehydrogenase type 6-like n=1 Tax=Varroa jacobsoni TaxID=62625 RepID=UPI000BF8DBFD|nr:17-beta-hydroxysteroid dehydrogenase type 6-like [Varroa jacobsoni]